MSLYLPRLRRTLRILRNRTSHGTSHLRADRILPFAQEYFTQGENFMTDSCLYEGRIRNCFLPINPKESPFLYPRLTIFRSKILCNRRTEYLPTRTASFTLRVCVNRNKSPIDRYIPVHRNGFSAPKRDATRPNANTHHRHAKKPHPSQCCSPFCPPSPPLPPRSAGRTVVPLPKAPAVAFPLRWNRRPPPRTFRRLCRYRRHRSLTRCCSGTGTPGRLAGHPF